ncbi:MAG: nicotinamide-nucleotide amidohydrolase family protein [Planctomycetales bacterium]
MTTRRDLDREARRLASLLLERGLRLVLAESCTGGLVSASLAGVPGISEHFCGSAVVYRPDTKVRWLGIPRELLEVPGPVSAEVAIEMARGALERTPEADVAASVTGHLGPDAPPEQDGLLFAAVAVRGDGTGASRVVVREHRLDEKDAAPGGGSAKRRARQRSAALIALALVREVLERER